MNIPEYALVYINKQGSVYVRTLIIPDIVHGLKSLYKIFAIIETEAFSEPS